MTKLFKLTIAMIIMATTTATPSGCEDCNYKTEQWEDQMNNATGPPCPYGLQEATDSMYYACGGCKVNTDPNFWNVTVGSEWDDTNNATKDVVEVFGCSKAHHITAFSFGMVMLMTGMVVGITAVL